MKLDTTQKKVFATLFSIGLIANLDKGMIGAISPYLADAEYMANLGLPALDRVQIGNLTSFYYLTFIVMTFVAGWFVDKFGYKLFVPIALSLLVAGDLLFGAAGVIGGAAYAVLILIARMIVGFGQAGYTNGTPPVIAKNFSQEQRGGVQGKVVATAGIGTILVYLIFQPFIISQDFRTAYWILAALFAVCVVMFVTLVPGRPKQSPEAAAAAAAAPQKDVKITDGWKNRNVLVLALTLLLNNLVGVGLLTWANIMYVETFAPTATELTIVMVGYGITLLIATWTAADVIKKYFAGKEKQFMLLMSVLGAVFLVGTVMVPSFLGGAAGFWGSALCLWLANMAIMWAFGVILLLPYQTIPVRIIGSAFAVINIGAFVGGIVQGSGIGALAEATGGYTVPFIALAALLLVSGLVPFLLQNKTPEELAAG
ncbi:MFS transporter [Corynebacterium sp.]|uniref:MFS transporter n=1 Tax=Corynebacterium sp. TaxID=1720 RepID=UPI0026DEBBAF|nr:MFS transporter [Corynebacterium sp.]MDO5512004.1 MFS transporter [Corynebacterium sp.]